MKKNIFLILLILSSCNSIDNKSIKPLAIRSADLTDRHSVAHKSPARAEHLELSLSVDFDSTMIRGVAAYSISRNTADNIHFDIKGLTITRVMVNDPENYRKIINAEYTIKEENEHGKDLIVAIDESTLTVHIVYKTSNDSEALQWLKPEQTFNKNEPFLYTQGFPNLTRTWIPIQDSPGIKITYNAQVKIPRHLMAVMSASNPREKEIKGSYNFIQKRPVAPYLIALAVGDLSYLDIGGRTGVYAESKIIDRAYDEFYDNEIILKQMESKYGSYRWGTYDVLIMPPSFPYGGMENPSLSFITPTLIAGDGSLANLITHEMAHSWSGNLVTNATWNDFWLNEGFTVYLERRISRLQSGNKTADLMAELGYQKLEKSLNQLDSNSCKLKLELDTKDPNDAMTSIAYEKGYFFLKEIENRIGIDSMDVFLRSYFDTFAFTSIVTEEFLQFLNEKLIVTGKLDLEVDEWVYSPGLPASFTFKKSSYFEDVEKEANQWLNGNKLDSTLMKSWTLYEWLYFLEFLPSDLSEEQLDELDQEFKLSKTGNNEIKTQWYLLCIRNSYGKMDESIVRFLQRVGRTKYIAPIYQAYIDNEDYGIGKAQSIYSSARVIYHYTSTQSLDKMMKYEKE